MAKILVVGGAGYVGSAAVAWLEDHGHESWVLDDFSTGHRELLLHSRFLEARAGDTGRVLPFLRAQAFDAVMHFAARSIVSESVQKPELYYENNVLQTEALLDAIDAAGIRNFVFSSTCAIFGDPGATPIDENLRKDPQHPYGKTKLEVERLLERRASTGLNAIALRYFNASGAEPRLRVGEWHEPETHLIPSVLRAIAERRAVSVFGDDYPTVDGTCIRDYISVWDLAQAHGAAVARLLNRESRAFEVYNLGSENGYSVREVIDACAAVTGETPRIEIQPRRAGDPPRLVAASAKARADLGFRASVPLPEIVRSAWAWEKRRVELKAALR